MFSFLKLNPRKKIQKKIDNLYEKAMMAQRSGNIRLYSEISGQIAELQEKIKQLEEKK